MSDENIQTNDDAQEEVKENTSVDCKNCEEYKLGWQRATADYQNLVRETAKQKAEWMQMIKGNILEDFIFQNILPFKLKSIFNNIISIFTS